MTAARFLADLRVEIETHPGVNHLFLSRCATSPFSRLVYRVFGENHYPLVCVFTSYLERLLVRAPTSDAKLWLAKVLVDAYGAGSDGAAPAHGPRLVPVRVATSKAPCGPMTISDSANALSGNAPNNSV